MKKPTQEQIVEARLTRYGAINNLWAIDHHIWRLGAIICRLRVKGLKIEGEYLPNATGGLTKIYNYVLVK